MLCEIQRGPSQALAIIAYEATTRTTVDMRSESYFVKRVADRPKKGITMHDKYRSMPKTRLHTTKYDVLM